MGTKFEFFEMGDCINCGGEFVAANDLGICRRCDDILLERDKMRLIDRTDLDLGDKFKFDYTDPQTFEVVAAYPNGDRYFRRPSGGWAKLAPGPEVYQL